MGEPATYNLLPPEPAGAPLATLPLRTAVAGVRIDRRTLATRIDELRRSDTKGKVSL